MGVGCFEQHNTAKAASPQAKSMKHRHCNKQYECLHGQNTFIPQQFYITKAQLPSRYMYVSILLMPVKQLQIGFCQNAKDEESILKIAKLPFLRLMA